MTGKKKEKQTVAIATLGCKVNQCESASFHEKFVEKGCSVTSFSKSADIYVINTCAVTAKAAAQSRQLIRKAHRCNPDARVIVTGCYAQVEPQKIREILAGPGFIVGNANKHQLIDAVLSDKKGHKLSLKPLDEKYFKDIACQKEISLLPVKRFLGRTRAFLKIQDGCNNFCTYCIVPYARGRSRSLPMDQVLDQAGQYTTEGHSEIVITGIHVGHYGLDLNPPVNLLMMLQKLTSLAPEVRFRLSSLEPTEISDDILMFMMGTDNFMPHLHIPLQSGSNEILKKMNRKYSAEQFAAIIKQCKEKVPDAAIGIDVLVGFPGETEQNFMETYDLLANLPVTYLHVFPYSRRPGTPAAKMKNQVPAKIKAERVAVLRKLDHKKRSVFYESRIGKVHRILVESEKSKDGLFKGFTENYIPVHFEAKPEHINQVVPVKLKKLMDSNVIGTLL
ncbi:MAG: tRNA (N(6)-L-threonylcarbamoyladenosine(37)-C(2))-methylthiotransferase MtaB [Deltaproteobacteria bacterium]|jgi:threonylcarbamoyladenosine tRNA methylthiotransferase MtaB|nr:tRNA (N(6)-L-threonylcarbamoyladenosine(37)-C(2))-methylthiotransferase MtaB [Deltaproteobacteria bacterium]